MLTTSTSKAQVTVPAAIRRELGLGPGDQLDFTLDENGRLDVRPVKKVKKTGSIMDLAGVLHRPGQKALTDEELDEVIGQAICDHVLGHERDEDDPEASP